MIEDGLSAFASGFHYCEVVDFGVIAQPINVLGNLGFLIAFIYSYCLLGLRTLTYSTILIFLGSSLWHATLHPVGLLLDIAPIILWVVVYLWATSRYFFSKGRSWLIILGFLIMALFITRFTADLIPMRSGIFLVSCILLFIIGSMAYNFNRSYAYLLVAASLFLSLAIVMRLVDMPFCDIIPIGTHWLWHLLSSFTIIPLTKLLYLVDKKYKQFV